MLADELSREIDFDDWGISELFFHFIDGLWGPHSVDMFADELNTKLPILNSKFWCPNSNGIDAFSSHWRGENNWLVPPINRVGDVLMHIKACSAVGTLVVPEWPSAPFWPLLFSESSNFHSLVSHVIRFNDPTNMFVQGRNRNSIFGSSKFTTPVLCLRLGNF